MLGMVWAIMLVDVYLYYNGAAVVAEGRKGVLNWPGLEQACALFQLCSVLNSVQLWKWWVLNCVSSDDMNLLNIGASGLWKFKL